MRHYSNKSAQSSPYQIYKVFTRTDRAERVFRPVATHVLLDLNPKTNRNCLDTEEIPLQN